LSSEEEKEDNNCGLFEKKPIKKSDKSSISETSLSSSYSSSSSNSLQKGQNR